MSFLALLDLCLLGVISNAWASLGDRALSLASLNGFFAPSFLIALFSLSFEMLSFVLLAEFLEFFPLFLLPFAPDFDKF